MTKEHNETTFKTILQSIISEKNFVRLNTWLSNQGFTVEKVSYSEIAKQEGLLRCSTLPLVRD
mgnify:CR=1 FL=1